jgi:hypothetical protein
MNTEENKYQKAKKRVKALRGFYIHLTVYVVVNLMLFSINMIVSPDSLWFFWPLVQCRLGGEKDQRNYGERIEELASSQNC